MKRGKKMLLFVLVLALAVGIYVVTQKLVNQETETTEETTGSFDLTAKTLEDLSGISYTKGEEEVSLVKVDGVWQVEGDAEYPLIQDDVADMAEDVIALKATRKVENVTDLSSYGLAEPAFTLKATWSDGSFTLYKLGNETPFEDGYYLALSDRDDLIYTVADDFSDSFSKTKADLLQDESIPTVGTVTALQIGESLKLSKGESSVTVDPDELWTDGNGAALDTDEVEDLADTLTGLSFSSVYDFNATEDELAAVGLDEANAKVLSATDSEGNSLCFLVGGTDENGAYYAKLQDSAMIHLMAATNVDTLLNTTVDSLKSTTLLNFAADHVVSAEFIASEKSYTWVPVKETEDAATTEGEATAEATAEPEEDPGEDLWATLKTVTAKGAPEKDAQGEALLTVKVVSDTGATAEMSIYEYDAEKYLAVMGDRIQLVDAATVDKLLRQMKQI